LQVIAICLQLVLILGAFCFLAIYALALAELENRLFRLVEVLLVCSKSLEEHDCRIFDRLPNNPVNDTEVNATHFRHVQDAVDNLFVEQIA
jgi:hypothetical protein